MNAPARLSVALPADREAGAHARRALAERFAATLPEDALGSALLATTELVNNAVLHGRGRVELRAELRAELLCIEVIDEGDGAPAVRTAAGDETGGFGLRLIEALSRRWGVHEGTTHVWCEIPVVR